MQEGPRPIFVLIILILMLLLLGMVFAAIRLHLLENTQGIAFEQGNVSVYFCQTQDCEQVVSRALQNTTAYCAFYELDQAGIINALSYSQVLVFEETYEKDKAHFENISVAPVFSKGLMHHKFCVFGNTVITGSMNPTFNDVKRNDNNLLVIDSKTLSNRYAKEYAELQTRKSTKYTKQPPAPVIVNISGVVVEQYFCPQEYCEDEVLDEISQAKQEISFMLFTFTSDKIGDAMILAHQNNITVQGVIEKRQRSEWSELAPLQKAGLAVKEDGNSYTMHHKVIIIDNKTVVTGSFNPTASANEKNDENVVIIHDPTIAMQYRREFERVFSMS